MKNRKYAMLLLMTAVMAMGSTGCGTSETADSESREAEIVVMEDDERDGQGEVRSLEADATENATITVGSANSESADMDKAKTDDDELSDDWTDMEFIFDGERYQIPASYEDLEESGWSFDLADYGHEDGYMLNPGDKTYATIELENPKYDEDLTVWVGFVNTSNKAKDITECDIWSFELDTCLGFDQVDNYPDMEIAQGIGIGSTEKAVERAFGECDSVYESDYGYVSYTYEMGYDYVLRLDIDDEDGVTAIEISNYDASGDTEFVDDDEDVQDTDDEQDDEDDEDDKDEDDKDEDNAELSDDWTDMEFVFDGEFYQIPASYSDLEDNGWSFDLADYGYDDGYVLNPGDKTYASIRLENSKYEDVNLYVGFVNTSNKAKDITECDIWSFELETCLGFEQAEDYPDMEIAQGVGIGSTVEDVEEAFGECDDIYESDYDYVEYTYELDYDYELRLTIFEDYGVTAIDFNNYGL